MEVSSTGNAAATRRNLGLPHATVDRAAVVAGVIAIVATVAISAASAGTLLVALLIFGAVLLCVWMFVSDRYELTLAVVMLYLALLDGYVKLKLNTSWATLGRDALLYAIVAGALVRAAVRRERIQIPPLTGWVLAFCAVVLMQVFNPAAGSWSHAVASVRPHLEFVPLFFLGYWTMRSKARLRGFLALLLLVAAINGVVGFLQFNMTPAQFASWGPGYSERIYGTSTISGRSFVDSSGTLRNRPFGLGGDAGFGGIIGMLAVPAGLALLLGRARTRPFLLGLTVALGAGVAAGVITSQARVAVVMSVLAALVFGVLASVSRRLLGTFTVLATAVVVALVTVTLVTGSSKSPFRQYKTVTPDRVLTTTYQYRRATFAVVPEYATRFPLGAGIGSAGPAAGYGGPARGRDLNAESEPTYLLIELGIPGLLVLFGFNLKLLSLALRRVHRLQDVELRLLLAALLAPLFAMFAGWVVGIATASTPTAPYFWFVAGIAAFWLSGSSGQRFMSTATAPSTRPRVRRRGDPSRLRIGATGPSLPRMRRPVPAPATRRGATAKMKISLLYRGRGDQVDGILDYARGLCEGLDARSAEASLALMDGRELPAEVERSDAVVLQYNPFSYGRWGYAPWLPAALKRLNRKRPRPIIAVMVHEPYMPLSGLRASVMGVWQRYQLAKVRRAADVTFVSVEPWLKTVRRWGPTGPIHHVPVGSNLPDMRSERESARAELGVDGRTIVLAAFGTSHPSRMMDRIGGSARALSESGHPVVLLNLGVNAPIPEGIPKSVRVETPGFLEPVQVARRLSAADLFMAPFVDGVSSRRGTFVAALQHALPIVGTEGSLTDPFLRNATSACRLVPAGSPQRFAETVVELADQPSEREKLSQGARLLYEREFTWQTIGDRVLMHLRDVFLTNIRDAGSKRRS
jgi:glycosyltransferase involved in cell wall biosynthesis